MKRLRRLLARLARGGDHPIPWTPTREQALGGTPPARYRPPR